MDSSRRDFLNDMAEHMPILKNNQNTYYPRFGFTPQVAFPKTGFCFYSAILVKSKGLCYDRLSKISLASLRYRSARFDDERFNQKIKIATLIKKLE